jgi:hypothetical protein
MMMMMMMNCTIERVKALCRNGRCLDGSEEELGQGCHADSVYEE